MLHQIVTTSNINHRKLIVSYNQVDNFKNYMKFEVQLTQISIYRSASGRQIDSRTRFPHLVLSTHIQTPKINNDWLNPDPSPSKLQGKIHKIRTKQNIAIRMEIQNQMPKTKSLFPGLFSRLYGVFDADYIRSYKIVCPKCRRINPLKVCSCRLTRFTS